MPSKSLVHCASYLPVCKTTLRSWSHQFILQYCTLCVAVFLRIFWGFFSSAHSLLSVILPGRTTLLVMQHIILLASLFHWGALVSIRGQNLESGQRIYSTHHCAMREKERVREMEKSWWHGQWGRARECNGLEVMTGECWDKHTDRGAFLPSYLGFSSKRTSLSLFTKENQWVDSIFKFPQCGKNREISYLFHSKATIIPP